MKRVALYPRVSGHEQEDNYSIPEQIDRMKKYCESRDWMVYKIYTDSGYSGSNMDRPGLQSLINDSEAGKFDIVLVYKLDRLSRSQKDVLYLVEDVFDEHGVSFVSMTENFDTSTPFGKAILGILAVFAQLERSQIRERTMIGKQARAEEGKWHGSRKLPVGFDYIDGLLIPNEYEVMQINEIADMFIDRVPVRTIERICKEKGYKHKYGEWTAKTIRKVLTNPVNIGLMKHKDKLYQGIQDPIMTLEKFNAIKVIDDERAEKYGRSYKAYSTLLTGMLYCKHCGARYTKNKNPKGLEYYTCYSRNKKVRAMIKDPNCKNKNYRVEDLDAVILSEIYKLSVDPSYIDELRENKPKNDAGAKIKTINSEIEKINNQISKTMDLYALGSIDLDMISNKVAEMNKTKTALEKELESLEVPDAKGDGLTAEKIQEIASLMNDEGLELSDKRNIVQSLIYYIEIEDENILIHWKF